MEIKSRLSLPIEKRSKSSQKDLLRALDEAEGQLDKILKSPYYDTYITLSEQVSDWNAQLKIGEECSKTDEEGVTKKYVKGKIDLFADKDSKEFERAFKYFSDVLPLLNALDEMRKKLTPEEIKKIEATSEIDEVREGIMNKRNGN